MSCGLCAEFCPFDAIKMDHDYELAVYDRYPQLVYNKAELTVPLEYYAALWPSQFAEEQLRRKAEEEEDARKAAEKARAAEEKAPAEAAVPAGAPAEGATAPAAAAKPGRSKEELDALRKQSAARAAAKKADGTAETAGEPAVEAPVAEAAAEAPAAVSDEAAAKKARLEELKRQGQPQRQRRAKKAEVDGYTPQAACQRLA